MKTYKIILADDHSLFRQGIKHMIDNTGGLEIIGEAKDGFELLSILKKVQPDMIVLDISMPNLRGLEAIREINLINPKIKILLLTMHKRIEYVYHAISAGAQGYLLKEDSDIELFTAIEKIRSGEIFITRQLTGELVHGLSKMTPRKGHHKTTISLRETEVLKLVAEGSANKDISNLLNIGLRTVENHRANIMKKLNLNNTAGLVRDAIRKGISDL